MVLGKEILDLSVKDGFAGARTRLDIRLEMCHEACQRVVVSNCLNCELFDFGISLILRFTYADGAVCDGFANTPLSGGR